MRRLLKRLGELRTRLRIWREAYVPCRAQTVTYYFGESEEVCDRSECNIDGHLVCMADFETDVRYRELCAQEGLKP